MRTIKRLSETLNAGKLNQLRLMANAYAKEKQHWLSAFQRHGYLIHLKKHREVRNQFVAGKYQSIYGLQARMWKLALIDAAETMDRYWQSLFEKVKLSIHRHSGLDEAQRHYCFWLLKDYKRLPLILNGKAIEFREMNDLKRKQAINFLKRSIKKQRKSYPQARLNRSFILDDSCYRCFEEGGKQYIKIMTLVKGQRIALPLKGKTILRGNIRIVLEDNTIVVHHTASIKKPKVMTHKNLVAIDFGYTEVLTDSEGNAYGKGFGSNMTDVSDWLNHKMRNRNKLHALQKKYLLSEKIDQQKKAKRMVKNNLGRKKLNDKINQHKATSLKLINTAFNEMIAKTKANQIISEDLSHQFSAGPLKNMNRRLSSWLRSALKERLSFKALVKGFDHQLVNPAYTSQTCPHCGFVDASNRCNRNKDKFVCQHCQTEGHSDVVAALNLKARYVDPEITRYMPYREVKAILLDRFHHRLETKQ